MDNQVEQFYRRIYADLEVDASEASKLNSYFSSLNPPPDKLVWLRSTAFRLGCEFISDDDKDRNVDLLRAINAIVHSLESTCMEPKLPDGNSDYDGDKVESYFQNVFSDLSVSQDENQELISFFEENIPPSISLVSMRAAAFKAAVDCVADDKETNVSLLRCINSVVHCFEMTCYKPKEYTLKASFDLDVSLSDAVQELWKLDANRLTPNADYTINVQEGKKPYHKEDTADDPLFTEVDPQAFQRPTYRAFIALLDNYQNTTGESEKVTSVEREEIDTFLAAIMQTPPMQYCHQYLRAKKGGDIPSSTKEFQDLLYNIWFDLYRRDSSNDSSGFEHVFVGEVKDDKVSGMHNWIQYYLQEKRGNVNYKGYIKPRGNSEAASNSDDHILTLQFDWNGVEKFVGTSFIGVSPEFEMALYTMCFLLGEEDNEVRLDTGADVFDLKIRCYSIAGDKIGTSFPEATAHYDD